MNDPLEDMDRRIYALCKESDNATCVAYRPYEGRLCPHHSSFEDGVYWLAEQLEVGGND